MNALEFKAALIEEHFFLGCPYSYPDPVDIYVDGKPLAREVSLILFPPKDERSRELAKYFYYMYIPLSAQYYREELAKPGKEVLLFTCTCGMEACSGIWIDVVFDKDAVVWTNWEEVGRPLPELPDLVFDKSQYLEALNSLDRFINHKVKEFQIRIENGYAKLITEDYLQDSEQDSFRELETDEWAVDLTVNELNEVVYARWDITVARGSFRDFILKTNEFLTKECGLLIPGVYKLRDRTGDFWEIANYFAELVDDVISEQGFK